MLGSVRTLENRGLAYLALIAVDQHWVTRRVQHHFLDIDDGLDGDDYGRILVRWDQDSNMSDARFFDILVEFGRVLGVDQRAMTH